MIGAEYRLQTKNEWLKLTAIDAAIKYLALFLSVKSKKNYNNRPGQVCLLSIPSALRCSPNCTEQQQQAASNTEEIKLLIVVFIEDL